MKKISTDLFDLIKTLTKSEKRYFQQFAYRHTIRGKSLYYELFQAINSQIGEGARYDEELLKEQFKGQKVAENLAVVKKQLYEQLLMALHLYHQTHSIHEKIKRDLHFSKILLKKRLFQQCEKRIKRIEKDIQIYGLTEYLVELTELKYQLATQTAFKNTSFEDLENYHSLLRQALQDLENIGEIRKISHIIQATHYKKVNVEKLQNEALFFALSNENAANKNFSNENPRFELERLRGLATYYFMTGQRREAASTNVQLLNWFDTNPQQLALFPEVYISIFNNYLIDNLGLGNFDKLEAGLQKLEQLPSVSPFKHIPDLAMRIAHQRFMIELNWILRTGDFQKSEAIIPPLETFLKKYHSALQNLHRVTFFYLMAYCHFALEKYGSALVYLNKILAIKENMVTEIIEFTQLLNVLTHFELGHYTLLESLIVNSRRWLKTRRELYQTEMLIFSYLKKWLNAATKKEQQAIWNKLDEDILTLKNDAREQRVLNYFNINAWIVAKKNRVSFCEVYK